MGGRGSRGAEVKGRQRARGGARGREVIGAEVKGLRRSCQRAAEGVQGQRASSHSGPTTPLRMAAHAPRP
eukprot:2607219-Alexandrium_andersonii.AAC.1